MLKIGLTGSIGMGKSTTAQMFRDLGVPVFDSDAAVHALYAPGGAAVMPLEQLWPGVMAADGGIDRLALRARVLNDPQAMAKLEAVVHPLVAQSRADFLSRHQSAPLVVLDVPLLFETNGQDYVDRVVVVSAPAAVQRARVLARPGMSEADFERILARQMPDADKRARADAVIDTGNGLETARAQVAALIKKWQAENA